MKDYEVLYKLRRDGAEYGRGSVVALDEGEASPLVSDGILRDLPDRPVKKGRPRKQPEQLEEQVEE